MIAEGERESTGQRTRLVSIWPRSSPPVVGLLIANSTDRGLLSMFLIDMDLAVTELLTDGDSAFVDEDVDLLIVDQSAVARYTSQLRDLKQRAGNAFLPILVLVPKNIRTVSWAPVEFDDVLRIPMSKAELSARVDVFLRLRAHSKAQYRSFIENAPVGIYRLTLDDRIVIANHAFAQMLGFSTSADVVGKQFTDLVIRAEPARTTFLAKADERGIHGQESTWWRQDSLQFSVSESVRVVADDKGAPIYVDGTVEDISDRKEAEEAVRRSARRFRSLIERGTDIIVVIDSRGHIRLDSPSVESALGYLPAEWRGQKIFDFIHPDDIEEAIQTFEECLRTASRPVSLELSIRHRNGSWRKIDTYLVNHTSDPDIEGIIINARDVTERSAALSELRESEQRLQALLDGALDAILVADDTSRYIYGNPAACKLLGVPLEELVTKGLYAFVGAGAVDATAQQYQSFLDTGHQEGVIQMTRPDGQRIDVEFAATANFWPGQHLSILHDVTERIHSEELLQESEQRFRAIFENAAIGVTLIAFDGTFVTCNHAFEELVGYDEFELREFTIQSITHPDDQPREMEAVTDVLEGRRDSNQVEKRFIRKDGEIVWARLTVSIAYTSSDQGQLVIGVIEDITERKQVQSELHLSEERFRAIFENAAMGVALIALDGTFVTCNHAFEELVGYDEHELRGSAVQSITHPDDQPREFAAVMEVLEGKRDSLQIEKRFIRKDGEIVWARLTVSIAYTSSDQGQLVIGLVEDINERKQAEFALLASEERFRSMFEGAGVGIGLMDSSRLFVACNPALQTMLGYTEEEFLMMSRETWIHPEELAADDVLFAELVAGIRDQYQVEKRYLRRDGRELWGRLTSTRVRGQGDESPMIIGMLEDITEQKRIQQQLEHDALHDSLTGLANRVLFTDRLDHLLARSTRREDLNYAVLFLDLDRFKTVNDSLGHQIGDQFLIAIGQRLVSCVRPGDTVARFGGDEFTVLVEDINHPSDATRLAERIQQALAMPVSINGVDVYTSASIGITLGSEEYTDSAILLRDADAALYHAKSLGRARFELFDAKMHDDAVNRLQLQSELRRAINDGELVVYFQPIISLKDGNIAWFEALVRWQHPQRGLLFPDSFVPLAEDTGLIASIDHFVLREACRQMRVWLDRFPDDSRVSVSVNLSASQFNDSSLPDFIQAVLDEEHVDGQRLRIEITESMVMGSVDFARTTIQRVREMGVHVHMDDFGTGYSSLSVLHSFAFNKIKIDRSFIQRMGREGSDSPDLILAIIAMAHSLNLEVVGEGIETAEQLASLRQMDCDYGQGYYFARPGASPSVDELMSANRVW